MALDTREKNDAWRPRVAVAQIGARMHYAVPAVFARAGVLARLYTDLCAEVGWVRAARAVLPESILPAGARRLFARSVPDVPRDQIKCYIRFGVGRIVARDRANTNGGMNQHVLAANQRFATLVARDGLADANVLYAFNGAALELLEHAKWRGIYTILEQVSAPVAHNERLLAEERARWPGWEAEHGRPNDWHPLADRERAEWILADVIVCGSQHVADTLADAGGPIAKTRVVPYAIDPERFGSCVARRTPASDGSLRVLCIANVQLGKGVQYLIETARLLRAEKVRMRLIGPMHASDAAAAQLREAIDVAGSVPRNQIVTEYTNADVFVLPTLSEGSATVCYEALAAGLPVITTPAAGSVVRDGVEGRIVPMRDPRALADAIASLARDRVLLAEMSKRAALRAADFTWDQYGQRLMEIVNNVRAMQASGN